MSRKLATTFSLLCAFCSLSLADNDTARTTDASKRPRPIDKGLKPLYVMTDTFLDCVHPESRGHALTDPRFGAGNITFLCFDLSGACIWLSVFD